MDRIDIAIIGGGVIGSAIAFNVLALRPELSVLVIERDPTYRTASSALSASSIRQQFSTPANIAMSRYSLAFLKDIETHLTVAGDVPDINLVERGYLCLATDLGKPSLERNHALQLEHNVDVDLLDPQQLGKQFPWLFTGDLAAGSLGRSGEGWFDGYSLLQAFRRKARALGATYVSREVIGIKLIRGRVDAVTLSDGSRIGCGKLVNAAGPWARGVAKLAGIDLPVHAAKHCIFVFDCKDSPAACPLVIDPSGVYFRPEGQGFIAGAPAQKDSPAQNNLDVDYRQFDEVVWPTLAARVPAFESIKLKSAWAGYYEMNTFDQNAILGECPYIQNFYFANGFSGHGMQHAPAAGRGMAELILFGEYRTVDLRLYAYDRLLRNEPMHELSLI